MFPPALPSKPQIYLISSPGVVALAYTPPPHTPPPLLHHPAPCFRTSPSRDIQKRGAGGRRGGERVWVPSIALGWDGAGGGGEGLGAQHCAGLRWGGFLSPPPAFTRVIDRHASRVAPNRSPTHEKMTGHVSKTSIFPSLSLPSIRQELHRRRSSTTRSSTTNSSIETKYSNKATLTQPTQPNTPQNISDLTTPNRNQWCILGEGLMKPPDNSPQNLPASSITKTPLSLTA